MISGNGAEYPLWVLLGAPSETLKIEWIIGEKAPSARFREVDFRPCAIICEACRQEWETLRGLPLVYKSSGFGLFLGLDRIPGP
jgi:hypothetical protein